MLGLLGLWVAGAPSLRAQTKRPNVLLLMADDLGFGDTGYNGHKVLQTPHLDAMSREGVRFDRFYAASPVCSPTRASCLTGRHGARSGVLRTAAPYLPPDEICLATILRDQGYVTGHFGKWHLGAFQAAENGKQRRTCTPDQHGFDEWFSTERYVPTFDPHDAAEDIDLIEATASEGPADSRYRHNGREVEEPLKGDDSRIVMDRTLSFINRAAADSRPFFAAVWFHSPHAPITGAPEFLRHYPDRCQGEQHYFACVSGLDAQVGRLRAALQSLGVDRDTMLWFCSDNGPEGMPGPKRRLRGSTGGLRGRKRSLYEGGIRVPALLCWPAAFATPRVIESPAVTSDFFPTVLDAIGVPLPGNRIYDGVSLMPLLRGETSKRGRPIAFHHRWQDALCGSRFKVVRNRRGKRHMSDNGSVPFAEWELYDLSSDPFETTNVAHEYRERLLAMRTELLAWRSSLASGFEDGTEPPRPPQHR